ncbi:unnamed protein product, partial [Onchocerca flexuosa]|uniref:DNA-directed RNA polymerase n=1 Tax=Onchocerca flexuosa TaxID=387005 RepID=A0A183HEZ4_9BILA
SQNAAVHAHRLKEACFLFASSCFLSELQLEVSLTLSFTRRNVRILESAGHRLWSFVKGSIKINKNRFVLHDEGFRDIQYRHLMLGRNAKLPDIDRPLLLPYVLLMLSLCHPDILRKMFMFPVNELPYI